MGKKKQIETSKKILIFSDILLSGAVIATFAALFTQGDISAIVELDIAIVGLSAAAHSFYFWKAKAENMKKYGQAEKIEMTDTI